jgi:hypothetical protein
LVTIVALGGLYFLVRQRAALGLTVVLWMVAAWAARSWLGFDPQNPDVLGYLLVPICCLALGVARIGPLLVTVVPSRLTVRVGAATVAVLGLLGAATMTGFSSRERCDLSRYRGAEVVAEEQLGRLPARSVLITDLFHTVFNLWAAQSVEGMRPDVSHFHLPFVGFPGYAHQVHTEHRQLRGVLRAALSSGELAEGEVSALAQRRPVYVEPSLTLGSVEPFLLPQGLLWEASAEPLSSTDLALATPPHLARWDELLARLEEPREEQTVRVLLWRLYLDALLLARRGEREGARGAIQRGLSLAPETRELLGLTEALANGTGPVDITPYLPPGAPDPNEPQPEAPSPNVLDF